MNHHHWEYIWIIFHIIHVNHWKPSRMFSTWTHQAFMWNMARNSSALIRPSPSLERHFFFNNPINPNNHWLFGIINALQCQYNHSSCWPSIGLVQINTYQGSPGASPFWPKVGCLWISGTPPCSNIVIIFHNVPPTCQCSHCCPCLLTCEQFFKLSTNKYFCPSIPWKHKYLNAMSAFLSDFPPRSLGGPARLHMFLKPGQAFWLLTHIALSWVLGESLSNLVNIIGVGNLLVGLYLGRGWLWLVRFSNLLT